MDKFFAEDNPFNAALTKIFDLCVLNVCALICCIPVVTAGASMTALYAVMLPMTENKEGPIVKSFLRQFRANLKGSVKTWLLMLFAALVLMFDLYVWTKTESSYRSVFFGLTIAMLTALTVVASWYFGLRATFEDTGKMSLINAGKYALIYLPASVLMGAYTAGLVYVYLQQGYIALFIPIFGITLIEYPKAWYMRQKFNAYIEDHSDIYNVPKDDEEETDGETDEEGVQEKPKDLIRQEAEGIEREEAKDDRTERIGDGEGKTQSEIDEEKKEPENGQLENAASGEEKAQSEIDDEEKEEPENGQLGSTASEEEKAQSEIDEEKEAPENGQLGSTASGEEKTQSEIDEEKEESESNPPENTDAGKENAENKKDAQSKSDKTPNGEKKTAPKKNSTQKKNKNSSKGNRNKKKRKKKK